MRWIGLFLSRLRRWQIYCSLLPYKSVLQSLNHQSASLAFALAFVLFAFALAWLAFGFIVRARPSTRYVFDLFHKFPPFCRASSVEHSVSQLDLFAAAGRGARLAQRAVRLATWSR